MSIFAAATYKEAITIALKRRRDDGHSSSLAGLAEAAQVQRSYLSNALNHDGQLSSDQLFLALKYLRLTKAEKDFVHLLYDINRSGIPERKTLLEKKLERSRAKALSTENYIASKVTEIEISPRALYLLDPTAQLVNMFLTIERFSKNPRLMTDHLSISDEALDRALTLLLELKVVSRAGNTWIAPEPNFHLPEESALYHPYRLLMRMRALEHLQKRKSDSDYSFSVVFTADLQTRDRIKVKYLEFLKEIEPLVKAAKSEEVYQLNFDLLAWSATK